MKVALTLLVFLYTIILGQTKVFYFSALMLNAIWRSTMFKV